MRARTPLSLEPVLNPSSSTGRLRPATRDAAARQPPSWTLLLLAWLVAVVATACALFIGEVMGMTPCVLCWWQRIAMFPLAVILGMACYGEDRRGAVYALPLAPAGLGMAGYHTLLVAELVSADWIPCGAGVSCARQSLEILGGIQIPWLSLAAFGLISGLLIAFLRKKTP